MAQNFSDYYGAYKDQMRDAIRADDPGRVVEVGLAMGEAGLSLNHVAAYPFLEEAYALGSDEALKELLRCGFPRLVGVEPKQNGDGRPHTLPSAALRDGRFALALDLMELGTNLSGGIERSERLDGLAREMIRRDGICATTLTSLLKHRINHRDEAIFLYRALEAGRGDLARWLLGRGFRAASPATPLSPNESAHLIAAIHQGLEDLIVPLMEAGVPVNLGDRDGRRALHHVVLAEDLSDRQREDFAVLLARHGATPELRDRRGSTVLDFTAATGEHALARAILGAASEVGPRQYQDARKAGILELVLTYNKADGFIYRVGVSGLVFGVGGDYDGMRELRVTSDRGKVIAREEFARLLHRYPNLAYFQPFLEKLLAGEEFPLAELLPHFGPRSIRRY